MGTLLRSAERLAVPVAMLLVLGAVGFITAATGGITDTFLAFYSMLWFGSLLFVAYWSRARAADPTDGTDPLLVLQQRYARGEIDETTFERQLDRLMADERLEQARRGVEREAEAY
jgi:uncharacterized membrane protein